LLGKTLSLRQDAQFQVNRFDRDCCALQRDSAALELAANNGAGKSFEFPGTPRQNGQIQGSCAGGDVVSQSPRAIPRVLVHRLWRSCTCAYSDHFDTDLSNELLYQNTTLPTLLSEWVLRPDVLHPTSQSDIL
jgi:hypothetical protein